MDPIQIGFNIIVNMLKMMYQEKNRRMILQFDKNIADIYLHTSSNIKHFNRYLPTTVFIENYSMHNYMHNASSIKKFL